MSHSSKKLKNKIFQSLKFKIKKLMTIINILIIIVITPLNSINKFLKIKNFKIRIINKQTNKMKIEMMIKKKVMMV